MRLSSGRTDKAMAVGCLGTFMAGVIAVSISLLTFLHGSLDFGSLGDPGKGTDSAHLPVAMTPTADLVDGSVVRVSSNAFDANSIVGVAVCLREADTKRRGVDACDTVSGSRFASDAKGHLDVRYAVPRVITIGGTAHDCASRPKRCLLVAASASDFDQSGGRSLTFRTGLAKVALAPTSTRPQTDLLPIAADPTGPIAAGTEVTVIARGFVPGEPVLLAWCTEGFAKTGPEGSCQPTDSSEALLALGFRDVGKIANHADEEGVVVATIEARRGIDPLNDANDLFRALGTSTTSRLPPAVDCSEAAGRCSIVVAAAADTRRSAILPYTVAPA